MKEPQTAGLDLHNAQFNVESGPPFLVRDSRELQLDNIATRAQLAGAPVVRLDRCPGAIVRASRAFQGTDTFLSVGHGELKCIVLEGIDLVIARQQSDESISDIWKS